jgi:hypothetical protein
VRGAKTPPAKAAFPRMAPLSEGAQMVEGRETDADTALTKALNNYRRAYEVSIRAAPNGDAEQAKALVRKARTIATESGLSRALVHVLLDEVIYWPSWSMRQDFRKYVHFDALNVVATTIELDKAAKETHVSFSYKNNYYKVVFYDEGWSNFGDAFHHGRVEFHSADRVVLGLNIADDMNPNYSQWRDFDLYAFRLGEWTKALLEIAADIEASSQQERDNWHDADAVARSQNIEL